MTRARFTVVEFVIPHPPKQFSVTVFLVNTAGKVVFFETYGELALILVHEAKCVIECCMFTGQGTPDEASTGASNGSEVTDPVIVRAKKR